MTTRGLYGFALAALGACATTSWPDERGVPVPVGYAENAAAAQAFDEALTAARAGTTLPAPTVTPYLEPQVRRIAEAMQRGEYSAPAALADAARWGQAVYHRSVQAWVLDCREGARMRLPRALTAPPVLVISYAATHFRPRSAATVQCAIVVVSATGAEHVDAVSVGAPPK